MRLPVFQLHHGEIALVLPGRISVLAYHFPYRGDSHDHDRYREHRPADEGAWLLHGHVHERWRQRGRMINVGVDAWGGYPVTDTPPGPAHRGRRERPATTAVDLAVSASQRPGRTNR